MVPENLLQCKYLSKAKSVEKKKKSIMSLHLVTQKTTMDAEIRLTIVSAVSAFLNGAEWYQIS